MKKGILRILLLIIGLILLISAYALNKYNLLRTILLIIGLILLVTQSVLERNHKFIFAILFTLIYLGFAITIDYIVVKTFHKTPVLTLNILTTGNVKIYNSFGYRVWQCDTSKEEYIVDPLNKLGYFCSTDNINTININVISKELVNNFKKYQNTFIKLDGKVSSIVGNEYFTLNPYTIDNNNLNNQVTFQDNLTLQVYNNDLSKNISEYRVYDNITFIGRINSIEEQNSKYTIKITDTLITNKDIGDFTIDVTLNDACNLDKQYLTKVDSDTIYTSCLKNVLINYDNGSSYELLYALENRNILWNDFLSKASNYETLTQYSKFTFAKFDVIKCSNNDFIISNKNSNLDNICTMTTDTGTV